MILNALLIYSIVLTSLGSVASVLMIGKPRSPTTPVSALIVILLNGLVLAGLVGALVER